MRARVRVGIIQGGALFRLKQHQGGEASKTLGGAPNTNDSRYSVCYMEANMEAVPAEGKQTSPIP